MASKKSSKKSSKQSTRQLPESQRTTPVSQRYYSSPSTSWYCLPVASDLATQGNIADADDNAIEGGNVSEHGSTTEDDSATEDDSDNGRSSSFGPLNQMGLPENQVYRLSDFPPYDDITRPGTKDQATQTDETKDQATQTDALVASSTSILIEDGNGNIRLRIRIGRGQLNSPKIFVTPSATRGTKRAYEGSGTDSDNGSQKRRKEDSGHA